VGGSFAENTFEQDTYVNGIIDLVFKEDGKWIIMDYKTYAETEASHDLRKIYEPQLSAYKDVWGNLTGEDVGEAEIFFIMKRFAV
jgi:ATP-dependent exoDNAse (exonuclease V) beta subunit